MLFTSSALLACVATAVAAGPDTPLDSRQGCAKGYELCVAEGSTGGLAPSMGDGLVDMYTDLVNSINAAKDKRSMAVQKLPTKKNVKRNDEESDDEEDDYVPDLCCKADAGMQCLLLEGERISFCWDRFTTNYHFADGSYGNVVKGFYHTADGDVFNLINGSYTLDNGDEGNFYEEEDAPTPPTQSLDLPTPWTSSGVGTAIPGSELGAPATYAPEDGSNAATTKPTATITGATPATATPTPTAPAEDPAQTGGDDQSAGQALEVGFRPWLCLMMAGLCALM